MYGSHRTLNHSDADADFVEFERAGAEGSGEFKCAGCGYGISITHKLPQCPMCGEGIWERSPRSPFRQTLTGLTSRLN
jgi:predicted RNA-binding Zn-ribbon protein involved in translation (DUF1610 family)